jgi:hypothetical protein
MFDMTNQVHGTYLRAEFVLEKFTGQATNNGWKVLDPLKYRANASPALGGKMVPNTRSFSITLPRIGVNTLSANYRIRFEFYTDMPAGPRLVAKRFSSVFNYEPAAP